MPVFSQPGAEGIEFALTSRGGGAFGTVPSISASEIPGPGDFNAIKYCGACTKSDMDKCADCGENESKLCIKIAEWDTVNHKWGACKGSCGCMPSAVPTAPAGF